jgi:hypothetical protein
MPHRLASDGFLVAAGRREIWVGWEWAGYFATAYSGGYLNLEAITATGYGDRV